jgi:hypothetical protein
LDPLKNRKLPRTVFLEDMPLGIQDHEDVGLPDTFPVEEDIGGTSKLQQPITFGPGRYLHRKAQCPSCVSLLDIICQQAVDGEFLHRGEM